jgi:hypothetical protein
MRLPSSALASRFSHRISASKHLDARTRGGEALPAAPRLCARPLQGVLSASLDRPIGPGTPRWAALPPLRASSLRRGPKGPMSGPRRASCHVNDFGIVFAMPLPLCCPAGVRPPRRAAPLSFSVSDAPGPAGPTIRNRPSRPSCRKDCPDRTRGGPQRMPPKGGVGVKPR